MYIMYVRRSFGRGMKRSLKRERQLGEWGKMVGELETKVWDKGC
jgi:hypothetical protein